MAARKPAESTTDEATTTDGAPEGVAVMPDRTPETGPSDTSKTVNLVSDKGTKVTVPERMVDGLKGQGFKRA